MKRANPGKTRGRLVAVLKDGTDGPSYPMMGDSLDVGRTEGDVILEEDPYLSARHARVAYRDGRFVLRDLGSVNGVYAVITDPVTLQDGDFLLIGRQVLRFGTLPDGERPLGPATVHGVLVFGTPDAARVARLSQYTTEGVIRDVFHIYRSETVVGRETGDIVFTDDPFLSRRHASITHDPARSQFELRDLGSSNGTAIRIRGDQELVSGNQFRVGRHLFRFDGGAG